MTHEELQLLRDMMREEISGALAPVQQNIAGMKEDISGMKEELTGVKKDIAGMKEDIAEIKEDGKITREATNILVKWAEQAQVEVRIPLYHAPQKKAE